MGKLYDEIIKIMTVLLFEIMSFEYFETAVKPSGQVQDL